MHSPPTAEQLARYERDARRAYFNDGLAKCALAELKTQRRRLTLRINKLEREAANDGGI